MTFSLPMFPGKIQVVFTAIKTLATTLDYKIFIVGGFVRDLMLDKTIENAHDLDFVIIKGDALHFAELLSDQMHGTNIEYFKNFGTAHFNYDGIELEFVNARKESYTRESRKPIVEPGTLEDDISRRDFTINTMSIGLNKDNFLELFDPYNGMADLKAARLKTPLDSLKTFDDDPLRIFRMARFASKLGFEPDVDDLWGATEIVKNNRLAILSMERMSDEFVKLFSGNHVVYGLELLKLTGALDFYLPELVPLVGQEQRADYHHKDVWGHTLDVLDKICLKTKDPYVRMCGLFHDIGKPATKKFVEGTGWVFHGHEETGAGMIEDIFRRIKLPLDKADMVKTVTALHGRMRALEDPKISDSAIRRILVAAGSHLEPLLTLYSSDYSSKNNVRIKEIMVTTKDVVEKIMRVKESLLKNNEVFKCPVTGFEIAEYFNLKPGPEIGLVKTFLEEAILEGFVPNEHDAVYNYMVDKLPKVA